MVERCAISVNSYWVANVQSYSEYVVLLDIGSQDGLRQVSVLLVDKSECQQFWFELALAELNLTYSVSVPLPRDPLWKTG